jgi:hypothetical protein
VGETPTVVESPTVGETSGDHLGSGLFSVPKPRTSRRDCPIVVDASGKRYENKRSWPVAIAQHSMTAGEERVYNTLWHSREASGNGKSKVFCMGYDRIARLVRMDEKSVRDLLPKMIAKKFLDVVASENCSTRTGRTYRIYSYEAILDRQRAVGMTTVVKNGKAVEFVWPISAGVPPSVGVTPTVNEEPPNVRVSARVTAMPSVPGAKYPPDLPAKIRELMPGFDHQALNHLWEACKRYDPNCSSEEVVHCFRLKLPRPGSSITSPVGYMIRMVPLCFEGPNSEHLAFRAEQRLEQVRRQQRLRDERARYCELLEKPNIDNDDRTFFEDAVRQIDQQLCEYEQSRNFSGT